MTEDRPRWNWATVWEAIADRRPDAVAQVHGERRFSWRDFDRRADGIAKGLAAGGLARGDKVAQYLHNGPEYLESMFACFKAGLVPVNTNYRYVEDELVELWHDADAAAVVFGGDLVERCEAVRPRLPGVRLWLWVDTGEGACPPWAIPYESLTATAAHRFLAPWGRGGDDLFLLYTGGTTGKPKGVMWPQHELFSMLAEANLHELPDPPDPVAYVAGLPDRPPRILAAAPLMHGTAAWFSMYGLARGGLVATLEGLRFDPVEVLDTLERERLSGAAIVGDAFARPMVRALEAEPSRWDLSSLRVIFSSGVMFAAESKARLLAHAPRAVVVDGLGTSESGSVGTAVITGEASGGTAMFRPGPGTRVIDDEGREVEPGSGRKGRIAVGGHLPLGYHKDPEKTASTFLELDGERYAVAGDWAEVEADGTIRLLGRGSACINTGGEKVYAEEVEEVIKQHPSVADVVVVGVPDERFVEAVTAVVQPARGAVIDPVELTHHVRSSLAGYKAPRHVVEIDDLDRGPNGKVDHRRLRRVAREQVGARGHLRSVGRAGGMLSYEVAGSGPPLVLVHGGLVDSRSWIAQRPLACDSTLVMPDTRSAGRSTGFAGPVSMQDLVGDLAVVVDDAELDSFHLLGFSMGSLVAQAFTLAFPERVRSLVLVGTTAHGLPIPPREGRAETGVDAHVRRAFSPSFVDANPQFIERYTTMARGNEESGYATTRQAWAGAPPFEELAGISCPTLVVHAREDRSLPFEHAERVAETVPGARLEPFERVGHTVFVEAPERFNEVVTRHLTDVERG